ASCSRAGTGGTLGPASWPLDTPPLARANAVVGLRGDVLDAEDLQAGGLERTDRSLAARAGTLHEHLDLLQAVLHPLTRGGIGRHLGGERRRLPGPLEADGAGALPDDDAAFLVGQRDQRVVER